MFKVNNKDTMVSFMLTFNIFHTFRCLHCRRWTTKCRLGRFKEILILDIQVLLPLPTCLVTYVTHCCLSYLRNIVQVIKKSYWKYPQLFPSKAIVQLPSTSANYSVWLINISRLFYIIKKCFVSKGCSRQICKIFYILYIVTFY